MNSIKVSNMIREEAEKYYKSLFKFIDSVRYSDLEGKEDNFYAGLEKAARLVVTQAETGNKLMFIGNGASASIASHMSTDFWKNGGIKALAFNDSSLLTCVSNDYGYNHVFEKPVEMFADRGDVLFAVSSSGRSENILRAVGAARLKKAYVITLSGFRPDNPLGSLGDCNFYVPASEYGPVEIIHHSICHCILDIILKSKSK